ncbi:MAG: HAD-IIIA family hydrolase [Clostridia bacterium]|nr:HAD-IIIA family hydrolase [Clostridia bacterium]
MKAVILAGGKGTRIKELCPDVPKPMIEICGKPVLQRQIETLRREGIKDFLIITGYLSERITSFFGDGKEFGVNISYITEQEPRGTGGTLLNLETDDDILVCGGDLIFDFSLDKIIAFHRHNNALATLFAHPSEHIQDSTLICTDKNNAVQKLIRCSDLPFFSNLTNAGVQIISPELLKRYPAAEKADLDRDIIAPALETGRVFAYRSSEYVKDMGTPERFARVCEDIKSGVVACENRRNLQKAVFLDRDGTLNKYKGYITDPDEIELCDGCAQALRTFNELGYLAVVVTNQPVIARGDCTPETLTKIHQRLEYLLGMQGAYLDGIYFCPHHPDKGFPGERAEYKTDCDCRKPKPGMLIKAASDFNISIADSFLAGDSLTDVQTAENAGCRPVFIRSPLNHQPPEGEPVYDSLLEFANALKQEG